METLRRKDLEAWQVVIECLNYFIERTHDDMVYLPEMAYRHVMSDHLVQAIQLSDRLYEQLRTLQIKEPVSTFPWEEAEKELLSMAATVFHVDLALLLEDFPEEQPAGLSKADVEDSLASVSLLQTYLDYEPNLSSAMIH